jgi:hypothetical protein
MEAALAGTPDRIKTPASTPINLKQLKITVGTSPGFFIVLK